MDLYQFLIKKNFFTKEEAAKLKKEVEQGHRTLEELMASKGILKE